MDAKYLKHPAPTCRLSRSFAALSLFALVCSLVSCGGGDPDTLAESMRGWNVVFISMDTTRQDRVGCYGYERARTKNLDALADKGILFENAIAQCPVTLPSHATMFTGTHPSYHGVRGNGIYTLPDEQTTLAEILSDEGYQTGAVIGAAVLEDRYGLAQGFDRFDDEQSEAPSQFHYPERRAPEVTSAALRIADAFNASRPYFLWVHYFDPHGRYDPPPEFGRHFPDDDDGKYDGEIATMDHSIGVLLAGLKKKGLMKRTLVVAVSDHGEGFPGPHTEKTHGMLLYRDTLEIPMILQAVGGLPRGVRIDALVGTVDLTPTILELLEIENDEEMQGRSLAAELRGETRAITPAPAYAESLAPFDHYGWSPLYQIRSDSWKLVWGPEPELYDLSADPDQLDDVAAGHPDRVEEMKTIIRSVHQTAHASAAQQNPDIDATVKKRLAQLGYLEVKGGGVLPKLDERSHLGDPAKLIHLQDPIDEARRLSNQGKSREAIEILHDDVFSVDPGNLEGLNLLAKFTVDIADWAGAEKALAAMVARRSDVDGYRARLADVQKKWSDQLGADGKTAAAEAKLREAIANFESTIHEGMTTIGPLVNLAAVYLKRRQLGKAEALLRRAETIDPESFEVNINLATVLIATGRKGPALPYLERADKLAGNPQHRAAVKRLRSY